MIKRPTGSLAAVAIAGIAWTSSADAAGVVAVDQCATLSTPNTVYRLTQSLETCGDCLVLVGNRITVDMQNFTIAGNCPSSAGSGITDGGIPLELTVVKNGTVTGFEFGVNLAASSRTSVLAVTATFNGNVGIWVGGQGRVKSSMANNNGLGIVVDDRGQVGQCTAVGNTAVGILASDNCLVTMNTTHDNDEGIVTGSNCTVSYNISKGNSDDGINAAADEGASNNLVTRNTATGNGDVDFNIGCPSEVTNNSSSGNSYSFDGAGCHTHNNK